MPIMEKRASWLELFYDVAFIALVAQLTYLASTYHHTLTDFLNIGIIAYSIFIAWWATTANRNLQPQENKFDKFLVQTQMIGAFLMSVTMQPVFEGSYYGFFLALAAVRLLQAFMIIRMYYLHPETRPVTYNILEGFFAASALWALSAFLPDPYHFVVVFMALAADVLVPLTRGKGNTVRYLNVHHLQERLGLFLMLVVGESMIVVALSNSASGSLTQQLGIVFAGLTLVVAFWWLYFEHSDEYAGKRPRNLFAFLHAHGLLFVSLMVVSVGFKLLLEGELTTTAFSFVVAGMFGVAGMITFVRYGLHHVRVRACSLLAGLVSIGVMIVVCGYMYEQYVLATGLLALLFAVAAVADQRSLFTGQNN